MDKPVTEAQLGWVKIVQKGMLELVSIVERDATTSKHAKDCIDDMILSLNYLRRLL